MKRFKIFLKISIKLIISIFRKIESRTSFGIFIEDDDYVYLSRNNTLIENSDDFQKIPVFLDIILTYEFVEHQITKQFILLFNSETKFKIPFYVELQP